MEHFTLINSLCAYNQITLVMYMYMCVQYAWVHISMFTCMWVQIRVECLGRTVDLGIFLV